MKFEWEFAWGQSERGMSAYNILTLISGMIWQNTLGNS